jgi:hypothetical protein
MMGMPDPMMNLAKDGSPIVVPVNTMDGNISSAEEAKLQKLAKTLGKDVETIKKELFSSQKKKKSK